ncbi:helix-turn-helix domain-containing protein [Mariniluteicoccus flavus]
MSESQREAETYVPAEEEHGQLLDLVAALEKRGRTSADECYVRTSDGQQVRLPDDVADVVVQVARALADGQSVTVLSRQRLLTTQEAADLLNVSRPTLVRLLERGELPHEMRGRHRRVRLDELLSYQGRLRENRTRALDAMQDDAEAEGLYDLLDAPPAPTR